MTSTRFARLLLLTLTLNNVKANELGQLILCFVDQRFCLFSLAGGTSRLSQEILVEPENVVAHAGDTVQFPCIVSKEAEAIVTWCWNDFCTLGKRQFVREEPAVDGPIRVFQYSAYPRFQLRINERSRKSISSRCKH